jgi:hypothetical protein
MKMNPLNLNQDMNNPSIQRREFQTQHDIESLKPEPSDEHPAIQRREFQIER